MNRLSKFTVLIMIFGTLLAQESKSSHPALICYHNGRDGISYDDIIEHVGNGEYGSAWRDVTEKEEVQEVLSDAKEVAISMLDAIGNESLKGLDD